MGYLDLFTTLFKDEPQAEAYGKALTGHLLKNFESITTRPVKRDFPFEDYLEQAARLCLAFLPKMEEDFRDTAYLKLLRYPCDVVVSLTLNHLEKSEYIAQGEVFFAVREIVVTHSITANCLEVGWETCCATALRVMTRSAEHSGSSMRLSLCINPPGFPSLGVKDAFLALSGCALKQVSV